MDANEITSKPTVADEIRWDVDDALVIAKTLPAASSPSNSAERLQREWDDAVQAVRTYLIEQPVRSLLIAAAGGAVLTALLIAFLRGDRL